MAGTILVTGGSGYVAGFLIQRLVERGWQVRATVRSLAKEAAVRAALGIADDRLRFVAADLTGDAGWGEAMAGCSHVAHVASPLGTGGETDADALIGPARDGTLRVLRAARDAGVARFVMTSSGAAIAYGSRDKVRTYTEADWSDPDSPALSPYVRSKAAAERAARDWIAAEGGAMEFCTINPGGVFGPVLSDDFAGSIEIVKRLLEGAMPGTFNYGFAIVDVRDLADLHVRVIEAPGMAGERFIGAGEFVTITDVARILRDGLGERARKVPKRQLPDWLVRILARFIPPLRALVPELGRVRTMDAGHARHAFGWATRPARETILDTARRLIERGIVKI